MMHTISGITKNVQKIPKKYSKRERKKSVFQHLPNILPCPDFCVLIMIYLSPEPPQIPFTSFTG
jgi:hypothetical protein